MSVQSVSGAAKAKPIDIGTEIVPFAPPLLEGCPVPNSVQALITSFLPFSQERFTVPWSLKSNGKRIWPPIKPVDVVAKLEGPTPEGAASEVVTIDRLCERTGELFKKQYLNNICNYREETCSQLYLLSPSMFPEERAAQEARESGRLAEPGKYQISCGLGRSPEQALQHCLNPSIIQIWGVNYSDEELQKVLQTKQAKVVQITGNDKARDITLKLPDLEILFIEGTPFQTLNVTQCPKLQELRCQMVPVVSRSIQIDTRGLKDCVVKAETRHAITLLTTDAQGKETTEQVTELTFPSTQHTGIVTLDYTPPAQDKVDQKKEGTQS
jgi:hypothetical protein